MAALTLALAPAVNALFILAIVLAFAAARGGPRAESLDGAYGTVAVIGASVAIASVGLLLLSLTTGNVWGGGESRMSIGAIFWTAAYLTLTLGSVYQRKPATDGAGNDEGN